MAERLEMAGATDVIVVRGDTPQADLDIGRPEIGLSISGVDTQAFPLYLRARGALATDAIAPDIAG
jgi:hypothetical protein